MREAEHVASLVRQHLAAPAQQQRVITRRARFAIKCRIVTGEAVNADTIAQRSLSENKIPCWLRIKIFHRNRENTESIHGNAALEKVQDFACQNLRVACIRIAARGEF